MKTNKRFQEGCMDLDPEESRKEKRAGKILQTMMAVTTVSLMIAGSPFVRKGLKCVIRL